MRINRVAQRGKPQPKETPFDTEERSKQREDEENQQLTTEAPATAGRLETRRHGENPEEKICNHKGHEGTRRKCKERSRRKNGGHGERLKKERPNNSSQAEKNFKDSNTCG
jgi:hypothetical protein